jgi:alkanesulfonate monooxygenase SsuD/methylene tetrahydromethanopterin reductase-like flavin-dependent oxidoreductase (luciferase family)
MTAPAMRIGIHVPQYGGTWDDIRAVAEYLDRSAVDTLWVNDHLQAPGRIKSDPTFDAFTTLSALAPLTRRVNLGIAVLSAAYRPLQMAAKMASVLDVISGGRLIVGVGTGSDRPEHATYGFPFGTARERTDRLRVTLEVMNAMWEHPDGASVANILDDAPNLPQSGRPPVWLAAHGPVLLTLAGRVADGIIAAWTPPAELGARARIAHESALAAGRPRLRVRLYSFGLIAPSTGELHSWVTPQAQRLGTTSARYLRWLRTTGLVGTPDEVRQQLAAYAAAGATDVILALPERVPVDVFAAIADALAPVFEAPAASRPTAHGVRADANLVHLLVGRHRAAGAGARPAVIDAHGE